MSMSIDEKGILTIVKDGKVIELTVEENKELFKALEIAESFNYKLPF